MARAAGNVSRLQLARNVSRTDCPDVFGMYALSSEEMLLACGRAGLRVVSMHTEQSFALQPTAIQNVCGVAFDAHTDTLLVHSSCTSIHWRMTIISSSWCRCAATRANGSKCSVYSYRIRIISSLKKQII